MNKYIYPFAIVLMIVGFFFLDIINWLGLSLLILGLTLMLHHSISIIESERKSLTKEILEAAKWANVDVYELRDALKEKVYSYKWSHGDSESATYTGDFTESQYIDFVAESLRQKIYVKLISKE